MLSVAMYKFSVIDIPWIQCPKIPFSWSWYSQYAKHYIQLVAVWVVRCENHCGLEFRLLVICRAPLKEKKHNCTIAVRINPNFPWLWLWDLMLGGVGLWRVFQDDNPLLNRSWHRDQLLTNPWQSAVEKVHIWPYIKCRITWRPGWTRYTRVGAIHSNMDLSISFTIARILKTPSFCSLISWKHSWGTVFYLLSLISEFPYNYWNTYVQYNIQKYRIYFYIKESSSVRIEQIQYYMAWPFQRVYRVYSLSPADNTTF